MIAALKSGHVWPLYLGAMANLLASTMRTEIIVFSFLQWLLLIGRVRSLHVLAFGFLSACFFLLRFGYSKFFRSGEVTFLNANATFFAPDAFGKSQEMVGYLAGCFGSLAVILFAYLLALLIAKVTEDRLGHRAGGPPAKTSAEKGAGILALARRATVSLEYFPARCLLVGTIFIAAGLRSGNLEAQPRYWMAIMPYLCLVGGAAFSDGFQPRWMGAGTPPAARSVRHFERILVEGSRFMVETGEVPAEEVALIEMLSRQPEKGAVFDFMLYRDDRYIVYAAHPGIAPNYWGHGSGNPFGKRFPKRKSSASNAVGTQARKKLMLVQASLLDDKCQFLVLAHSMEQVSSRPSTNLSYRESYFRDDLQALNTDKSEMRSNPRFCPTARNVFCG